MTENINFKISVADRNPLNLKKPLDLAQAIRLIKLKKYPAEIEAKLIALISKQPNNTYTAFLKNIYTHLSRIQNDKKST